jgi:inner membrane protein
MPSPIAHTAAGIAIYELLHVSEERDSRLLWTTILFSILPDADSVLGLAGRDFIRFHNNVSHSLGFAAAAGALAGTFFGWGKGLFWRGFSAGFLAYGFHLGMDYWSTRRGIILFWPFSKRRFVSPKKLFYGFQWGLGFWNKAHLWTALTELLFGLVLTAGVRVLTKRLRK